MPPVRVDTAVSLADSIVSRSSSTEPTLMPVEVVGKEDSQRISKSETLRREVSPLLH